MPEIPLLLFTGSVVVFRSYFPCNLLYSLFPLINYRLLAHGTILINNTILSLIKN